MATYAKLPWASDYELDAACREYATDRDLGTACRQWINGCTCAPAARPQDCQECTASFLEAVLRRARAHGLAIGSNAVSTSAALDPTGRSGACLPGWLS